MDTSLLASVVEYAYSGAAAAIASKVSASAMTILGTSTALIHPISSAICILAGVAYLYLEKKERRF